ncbi:hypothetical protein B0F90DRAFT_761116 [Multifurca ochricompacta]|uniref:Chromo domain-containing protein n=1 Tax=Multifurca ochricompacta TaxID=376703 RepID=A0AAD4MCB9_9AGAM|nr:hypothetical protein B0F90DRAFT_761116 [Multifurca ochricompacta]
MDMENEYEVETILKAKVFMRGKKMGWKFFVKWKGYQDADNTWEPFKSFENSGEEVIKRFWDRIDTKDRDVNSVEGWTNGEEVFPTGPPRGRRRKDSSLPGKDKLTSLVDGATKREKRPLQSPASASPSKRKRASSSRRRSDTQLAQRARLASHTPVPDSQSEDEQLLIGSLPRPVSNGNLAGDRSPRLEEPPEVEISVSPDAIVDDSL